MSLSCHRQPGWAKAAWENVPPTGCPALEPWEAGASQWDHAATAQCFKCLWLSLSPGPGSGASMAEQDPATGSPRGKQQLPGQCALGVVWAFSLVSDS